MNRSYGLGLSIGIGTVSYTVLSQIKDTNNIIDNDVRIEDIGVRMFETGETPDHKNSLNQDRRSYRASRRLIRRRKHRKERVKHFLERIQFINYDKYRTWKKIFNPNIFQLKYDGLSKKLSPEEIFAIVIHFCNHRGYKDFYEEDATTINEKERGKIKTALSNFEKIYKDNGYISVSEMILKDPIFLGKGNYPDYHNHAIKNKQDNIEPRFFLIKREYLRKELINILKKQQQYYSKLTDKRINFICDNIVFIQRDFEDGPGDKKDSTRKYMGFLDSIGNCIYYKNEKRAFRTTIISDIYSLINQLSQVYFIDKNTEEISFSKEAANEIIDYVLINASLTEKDLKNILKKYDLILNKPGNLKLKINDCLKALKILKNTLEKCGYDYTSLIKEEQFNLEQPSKLQKLCILLSKNITPKRRILALQKAGYNKELQQEMIRKNFSSTANVSEKYMIQAIEAFKHGENYGNFQARMFKDKYNNITKKEKHLLLPSLTLKDDEDIVKNVVVFKAINETRKVINALIRKYGSFKYINILASDELGHSIQERKRIVKMQNKNRKETQNIRTKILELGLKKEDEITTQDIQRYKLYQQQNGIDLYTGSIIPENEILGTNYEIDYIVPFSLILDDTLNNKVLTKISINRITKNTKLPLQFLENEALDFYKKTVTTLFNKGKISSKKYNYLLLPILNEEILFEWKSRNLNDTRYICKFITNYISSNLIFDSNKKKNVYAIKAPIISKMRKIWLNKKTWGAKELDKTNNLYHAVNALVAANLTPAYVEIVYDNIRLQQIYREHHKTISNEYIDYLNKSINKMQKYYGFSIEYSQKLLRSLGKVPAILKNIWAEADIRLADNTIEYYKDIDDERFRQNICSFYQDKEFAESVQKVIVSYKSYKKFQGKITDDNPLPLSKNKSSYIKKMNNILNANKYYCIEVYKTIDNTINLRGIRFIDLIRKKGKLQLVIDNPIDYKHHIMYLFKNDYVKVYKNNKLLFKGYYKSVGNINQNILMFKIDNSSINTLKFIGKQYNIKKYDVNILGKLGGEIKCSVPFMFHKGNN
jgi:CRISPR-associated endonuclease Csn1